ncbi:hypothetical protein [uncultured Sphingomonas sp.]|uniref:hypothetical protein n=1 Tax=uncultured Sphingomonas sp. TaxID=158754 RepID=UPI0035CB6071
MPKRFAATEGAIEKGLENATPKSGAKLAHEWAAALEETEVTGAKGVRGDLEKLAKELEKEEPNQASVTKLLGKLGPATVKLADKCEDEKVAEKVRHLGQALQSSGDED